jgi:hypothetical protein
MTITDQEKALIRAFVENEKMADAVLKAILREQEADSDLATEISRAIDDAEYGRKVKVWIEARVLIERRFNDLKRIAAGNPQPNVANEAR